MTIRQTRPEEFDDRIIFMSMFKDIDWTKNRSYKECFSNSAKLRDFAKRFPLGRWSFLSPGEEEKSCGMQNYKPEGQWNSTADVMVANFQDSGHPFFGDSRKRNADDVRESLQCGR